ncbi:MAG: hypothetical protein IH944_06080 [Armatimonadetes bacterium]|nr:hypothetical protein [Armatimonadota bacterium]
MRYFLYLSLDQFYVRQHEAGLATVVHREGAVLDCCELARARGVRPGTPTSEAKAILREDARNIEYRLEQYTQARDRWLDICTLYSSSIEHESPATAWVDLSAHPEPVDISGRLISEVWMHTSCPISAGMASSKWVSVLAARPCDPSAMSLGIADIEPVESPESFLAPLPTMRLAPIPIQHRERLVLLGYRRVGDVRRAPLRALTEQFGQDGLLIHEAVCGRLRDHLQPNYPGDSLARRQRFEGGVSNQIALEDGVCQIASRLAEDLQARDQHAVEIHLIFELESGKTADIRRKLPKPIQDERALRSCLQYLLGQIKLDEPVIAVRANAPHLRKTPAIQRNLEPRLNPRERTKAITLAQRKIHSVFGAESILRASDVKPPRRKRLLRAWQHATGWR